jgi:hypothetical protein
MRDENLPRREEGKWFGDQREAERAKRMSASYSVCYLKDKV